MIGLDILLKRCLNLMYIDLKRTCNLLTVTSHSFAFIELTLFKAVQGVAKDKVFQFYDLLHVCINCLVIDGLFLQPFGV